MSRDPNLTWRLLLEASSALYGDDGQRPHEAQQVLARVARSLARALPVRESLYDPDLHGPLMTPDEIKSAAIDAGEFLEAIADLFGDPDDPDWTGDDFAFAGAFKRRPGWKPKATLTPAQSKRRAAAARVYELMAEQCFNSRGQPKQEAAVAAVMEESGLARSKVMLGLKEYREDCGWYVDLDHGPDGKLRWLNGRQARAKRLNFLAKAALEREWFRRNPNAHFLGVPAGSDMEKQLLSRESPRDPRKRGGM
jgi:hypothetical protein